MSVAELVPSWPGMGPPQGALIDRQSMRGRQYQLRRDGIEFGLKGIAEARGIEDFDAFANPTLAQLPDPSILKDMDEASVRFAEAIERNERVLVFGDYDVDGACSTSILVRFARMVGLDVDHFIPDRIEHGYGPSKAAFDFCMPEEFDLVVFVDCGTASYDLLKDLICDVIIIDHHKQQGDLPPVLACVNPHREDDTSGLGMMCAAALVFMFSVSVRRTLRSRGFFADRKEPDVRLLLDLAALATVADVVPLVGTSRLIVSAGLNVMKKAPSVGVRALMSVSGVNEPTSGGIGFTLGPRINAAGRVGSGSGGIEGALGVKLLICEDPRVASEIAARLNDLNGERQAVEKTALEEALEMAALQVERGVRIIGVFSKDWHPGVVGIVAGRIRERFDLPTIVGACIGDQVKASGRSVPGFDLGSVVIGARAAGKLNGGGGHAMACGLAVDIDQWDDLMDYLNNKAEWTAEAVPVDCIVGANSVGLDQVTELDALQPVGQGNPSATVIVDDFIVSKVLSFGKGHIRLIAERGDMEVLFWRAEDEGLSDTLHSLRGRKVAVMGVAKVDEWNGRRKISITGTDVIF